VPDTDKIAHRSVSFGTAKVGKEIVLYVYLPFKLTQTDMKTQTRLFLVLFLSAISLSTTAQIGTVIVFAPKGEKFTLFIGSSMKNNEPSARVETDNPGGPSFKMKVVFPDPSVKEISKMVFNKPGSTMYYKVEKNAKGVYALESVSSEWMEGSGAAAQTGTSASSAGSTNAVKESKAEQPVKSEPANPGKGKGCDHPMADPDFTAQLIDISARPFEPMQLSAAKKMAETHCLLVSQVILVIHVFDMESSRLSFAKYAYDFTYDRENYGDVTDALHSAKSKEDLDKYVAGKSK
jgi:hypothetical protein